MENVPQILPNTRDVHAAFRVCAASSGAVVLFVVGSCARSRCDAGGELVALLVAAAAAGPSGAARARFCRAREPSLPPRAAATPQPMSTTTAAASRAMKSQLTWAL